MKPGRSILEEAGIQPTANAITLAALIRGLAARTEASPTPEGRFIIHSSILIYSEEWSVFTKYGNLDLFSVLNDWFDCVQPWKNETKTQGVDEIPAVFASMIGATTPKMLREILPPILIGGGFTSRTIFVVEEQKGKSQVPMDFTDEELEIRASLVEDLIRIKAMGGVFKTTNEYIEAWEEWYLRSEAEDRAPHPSLDSYYARRLRHLTALSMILSAADRHDMILELKHLEQAIDLLNRTEIKMATAFKGFGGASQGEATDIIMELIVARKSVTSRELLKFVYGYLEHGLESFKEIMGMLESMQFCKGHTKGNLVHYHFNENWE